MAIDSALERFSATNLLLPFRGSCLPGTAGVIAAERQVAAWVYSGAVGSISVEIRKAFKVIARTKVFTVIARTKAFSKVISRIKNFKIVK